MARRYLIGWVGERRVKNLDADDSQMTCVHGVGACWILDELYGLGVVIWKKKDGQ